VFDWLSRWRALRVRGVLGMNARNTRCILDRNPRSAFPLVDNKRRLHELCDRIGVPSPRIFAALTAHSALRQLPRILEGRADFVVKPNRGAAGRGILVIVGRDGASFLRHNGQRLSLDQLRQHLSGVISGLYSLGEEEDEALLQQRVIPDPALADISYKGTADLRVILYRHEPLMAMLRLPTKKSGGRANLHQGAIGAGVDLETGRTCHAVLHNRVAERHPDTGAKVVGFAVPHWDRVLEMAGKVSRAVGLGYIGIDVVLDAREGPLLLEANARPGLAIQIANGEGLAGRLDAIDRRLGPG
jgi:alpha-L-glutamate ligase-like protein